MDGLFRGEGEEGGGGGEPVWCRHRSRHRTGTGAKVKATDDRGYHRVDKRGMTFGAQEHLRIHNNALQ